MSLEETSSKQCNYVRMHLIKVKRGLVRKHWEYSGIFTKETSRRYILSTEVQPTNLYVKTLLTFTTGWKWKSKKGKLQIFWAT